MDHLHCRVHHVLCLLIPEERLTHLPVKLHNIDRHVHDIIQIRLPCAEIIQRKVHAVLHQSAHIFKKRLFRRHGRGLRDLQIDVFGIDLVFFHDPDVIVRQPRVAALDHRQVHFYVVQPVLLQLLLCKKTAHFLKHNLPELQNLAVGLRHGDKGARRHQIAVPVPHPHKRFRAHKLFRSGRKNRLVKDLNPILLHGLVQHLLHALFLSHLLYEIHIHLLKIGRAVVTALPPRILHQVHHLLIVADHSRIRHIGEGSLRHAAQLSPSVLHKASDLLDGVLHMLHVLKDHPNLVICHLEHARVVKLRKPFGKGRHHRLLPGSLVGPADAQIPPD